MLKILLLILGLFVSFTSQAKVAMAISDEEKQALAEQEKNINRQQEQAEVKIPESSDALKK